MERAEQKQHALAIGAVVLVGWLGLVGLAVASFGFVLGLILGVWGVSLPIAVALIIDAWRPEPISVAPAPEIVGPLHAAA